MIKKYEPDDLLDVKCMKCGGRGHINCNQDVEE